MPLAQSHAFAPEPAARTLARPHEPLSDEALAAALGASGRHLRAALAARTMPDRRVAAPVERPRVAVLLPCFDEAASIARVVADFRAALPEARICVFDNGSTDGTGEIARAAGAEVFLERRRGKGAVVRRMFADIDADVYLMADGDGTYDAASAPKLVAAITEEHVDMAIGARADVRREAHRPGHAFGNAVFNRLYAGLFGADYSDIFSGYRAFSRRFVKSFPALSDGFEIETEMSVHAGQMMLPVVEIETPYGRRQEGSSSKLSSLRDGWRILRTFAYLLKETRPAAFFGLPALALAISSLVLAVPLFVTFAETGLVPRLPTAVLCVGMMLLAGLSATCGFVLDSLARSRAEHKRMLYLALAAGR